MNIAIVFYSFSGNTRKASLFLNQRLTKNNNKVDLIDLKPKTEVTSFFKQCLQAALRMRLQLQECSYDLDKYDFIIFASPVWAFTIAPALRSFLKKIKNLEGKKAACFLTFGSGAGSRKALKELGGILNKKGAEVLFSRNLSDKKIRDESYLENNFKHLLEIVAS